MKSQKQSSSEKQSSSSLVTVYLLIYNIVLTIGWTLIFYQLVQRILSYNSLHELWKCDGLWNDIGMLLKIFQTAAFLEVVHAMFGFVRSNPMIVFIQIISRVFLVWGVANYIPGTQSSIGIPLAVTAWSITEIIRYSYYALNLMQVSPQWLTWCRYSFFIVLYPMGVAGELLTIISAMRIIYPESIRNKYSIVLPNKLNFGFDYFYFLLVIVLAYTYFPTMYMHMFKQRAKTLNVSSSKKEQ